MGSVIMPGVEIGDGAMVMPNTFVPMNTKIIAGEIWGGNPITKNPRKLYSIKFSVQI